MAHHREDMLMPSDIFLLQLSSRVDENAVGNYVELVFAPIDASFSDDAPLIPSGLRIIPLNSGKDTSSPNRTLDLASALEVGIAAGNKASGDYSTQWAIDHVLFTICDHGRHTGKISLISLKVDWFHGTSIHSPQSFCNLFKKIFKELHFILLFDCAKVIGVLHGDEAAVILQTNRGNLECIYPRKLVLISIVNALIQGCYRDALLMVRQHRIDLILLLIIVVGKNFANLQCMLLGCYLILLLILQNTSS